MTGLDRMPLDWPSSRLDVNPDPPCSSDDEFFAVPATITSLTRNADLNNSEDYSTIGALEFVLADIQRYTMRYSHHPVVLLHNIPSLIEDPHSSLAVLGL